MNSIVGMIKQINELVQHSNVVTEESYRLTLKGRALQTKSLSYVRSLGGLVLSLECPVPL